MGVENKEFGDCRASTTVCQRILPKIAEIGCFGQLLHVRGEIRDVEQSPSKTPMKLGFKQIAGTVTTLQIRRF